MSEFLGEALKFIASLIIRVIAYIVLEIIGWVIGAALEYFFGRTRWFSVLYIAAGGLVGFQIFWMMQVRENPAAEIYGVAATVIVLVCAPFLHSRITAFIEALKHAQAEKAKREVEL